MYKNKWQGDWLEFFLRSQQYSISILGFFLLMGITISILFLNSERIEYKKTFYPLKFSINYLEFIKPGTKVRFQAALIVGVVDSIESDLKTHILHIRMKKDFHIPKKGSRITVQTWGYAGDKFINIDILEAYRYSEPYNSEDIVPMEKVSTFSGILLQIDQVIKKSEEKGSSVLDNFFQTAKETTRTLSRNKYTQKKGITSRIIRQVSRSTINGMRKTLAIVHYSKKELENFEATIRNFNKKIRVYLPLALRTTTNLKKMLSYKPNSSTAIEKGYWHEEASYYYLLSLAKKINQNLKTYANEPSQLIFD